MTIPAAAKFLGLSEERVRGLCGLGYRAAHHACAGASLPALTIGRRLYLRRRDVAQFLAAATEKKKRVARAAHGGTG